LGHWNVDCFDGDSVALSDLVVFRGCRCGGLSARTISCNRHGLPGSTILHDRLRRWPLRAPFPAGTAASDAALGMDLGRRGFGDGSACGWDSGEPASGSGGHRQRENRCTIASYLNCNSFAGAGRKARVERNECQRQVSCWSPDCSGHDVADIRVTERWPDSGHRCGSVPDDRGNLGDLRAAVCEAEVMFRGIGGSRCKSSTTKHTKLHDGFPEWFSFVRLRG
jgi:hypothetical protein